MALDPPYNPPLGPGECCNDIDCTNVHLKATCECNPQCAADSTSPTGGTKVISAGKCQAPGTVVICPPTKFKSIAEIIEAVTNWIFYLAVIIAPLIIIIGAFMFMTSGGEPNRVRKARNMIIWAAIGLAVILFSKGIYSIVRNILTGG